MVESVPSEKKRKAGWSSARGRGSGGEKLIRRYKKNRGNLLTRGSLVPKEGQKTRGLLGQIGIDQVSGGGAKTQKFDFFVNNLK